VREVLDKEGGEEDRSKESSQVRAHESTMRRVARRVISSYYIFLISKLMKNKKNNENK